jgi:O-antigen biosynthesis protein
MRSGQRIAATDRRGESRLSATPTGSTRSALQARLRRIIGSRLPADSPRRAQAKAIRDAYRVTRRYVDQLRAIWRVRNGIGVPRAVPYSRWLRHHLPSRAERSAERARADRAGGGRTRLRFTVVVLAGAGDQRATVDSLTTQTWPDWQALVASVGPVGPDERVTRIAGPEPAAAITSAVSASDADLVLVLRGGDVLDPSCLAAIEAAHHQDPLGELFTWDDDVVDGRRRREPRFRPSWSPEMLLGADYIGSAFAVSRRAFLATGGLAADVEPHASWNLLLSLELPAERIVRIPRVLSSVTRREPPHPDIAPRLVQRHLDRRSLPARAELVGDVVRVRWQLPAPPSVTVVIPTRHNRAMLSRCLPSLAATDYPGFDVVVVDNGGQTAANEQWYSDHSSGVDLQVVWWTEEPFNYSAVNNAGVRAGRDSDVIVLLNDDTELPDPSWLTELVGWAVQPELGIVGLQLLARDGTIQHTGVILGLLGFADHVFEGALPGEDTYFGRTDWYRNTLAVTGACLALRREVYDRIGGLDERFELCGSDVALGLDATVHGWRNLCSPFGGVRHLESATRGKYVPRWDFFMSFWRYSSWLFGGDPYYSPNLSLSTRIPRLKGTSEPTPRARVAIPLGRSFEAFRQTTEENESLALAAVCRATDADADAIAELHALNADAFEVRTVNWYIPDIDSPFYGGINTALRIADYLARQHGVENRFVVWGPDNDLFVRSALTAAFPALRQSQIAFYADPDAASLAAVPPADVSIATLWVTAYAVAHAPNSRRKFYLVQDYEPMFYPAGTQYALAEETYRLGLYGLCNTDNLRRIYEEEYGGSARAFIPAVDPTVFHAEDRPERTADDPVTLFVYGRPGHWRNCWELASQALTELKRRHGDRVRILTAGAWAAGGGAMADIKRLGLLDYRATGELYRHCDVGLALTVSKHPSYLPLELMSCGVPVVAFDNSWGYWVLHDGENSLLARRTVDSLVEHLDALVVDSALRRRFSVAGLSTIAQSHSDWTTAIAPIYGYLCDPEGRRTTAAG